MPVAARNNDQCALRGLRGAVIARRTYHRMLRHNSYDRSVRIAPRRRIAVDNLARDCRNGAAVLCRQRAAAAVVHRIWVARGRQWDLPIVGKRFRYPYALDRIRQPAIGVDGASVGGDHIINHLTAVCAYDDE